MRRGSARIGASRSTRRRAISPCSQGSASLRRSRASAARAPRGSTPRALPGSLDAMAREYIEPMLATRWPNAVADAVGHAIASRGPSECAICRGWGRGRICASCLDRFAAPLPRCRRCALPLVATASICGTCLTTAPSFDAALGAVDYRAPWDRLVTAFKFHGQLDLAAVLADLVVGAERRRAAARPSLVLPVPLASARWRERGYNQAWELARRVASRLDIVAAPICSCACAKRRTSSRSRS